MMMTTSFIDYLMSVHLSSTFPCTILLEFYNTPTRYSEVKLTRNGDYYYVEKNSLVDPLLIKRVDDGSNVVVPDYDFYKEIGLTHFTTNNRFIREEDGYKTISNSIVQLSGRFNSVKLHVINNLNNEFVFNNEYKIKDRYIVDIYNVKYLL